jgi:hypothetical protein
MYGVRALPRMTLSTMRSTSANVANIEQLLELEEGIHGTIRFARFASKEDLSPAALWPRESSMFLFNHGRALLHGTRRMASAWTGLGLREDVAAAAIALGAQQPTEIQAFLLFKPSYILEYWDPTRHLWKRCDLGVTHRLIRTACATAHAQDLARRSHLRCRCFTT